MQPNDAELDQPPPELTVLAQWLDAGEVIAFPTETVFGLLARIDRPLALRHIFALKGRPPERALPVIAADPAAAFGLWSFRPPEADLLIDHFWPGPLTIVLPAHPSVDMLITGGSDNIGVRVPGLPVLRQLCAMAGGALVATSANPADQPPAMSREQVAAYFGDQIPCYAAPPLKPSRGSTILEMTQWPPLILRNGDVSAEQLEAVLGVRPAMRN